jgi:hypothetical protein
LAVLLLTHPAAAEDARPDLEAAHTEYFRFFLEESALITFQIGWYYSHTGISDEDFDLQWDWPSWDKKLTSLPHFDTNGFYINAISHTLAGTLEYQVARANGIGVGGATLVGLAGSVLWEYFVEYKERPSLNDLFINTTAGVMIGEPAAQISRALRRGRPTPGRWVLALGLAPFEFLNDGFDRHLLLSSEPAPWLRDRVWTGGRFVAVTDQADRGEVAAGMDLELADQRGYGRAGEVSSWTHVGAWSGIEFQVDLLTGGKDAGVTGARASTRTSLFGHYRQDLTEEPTGLRGTGLFVGADTGFDFDIRLIASDWDRLAAFHLIGPDLSYDLYLGPATLRWQTRAYVDLAMIDALVFGPVLPFTPSYPPTSALRSKGYYFGYGTTVESQLRVELPRWSAALALRGHQYWSIDGLDRTELSGFDDPHDVQDQRAYAHLELDVPFGRSGWGLALTGDLGVRHGAWSDQDRLVVEKGFGASITATP